MLEVEIKILEINPQEIAQKILSLGGTVVTEERLLVAQKFDTNTNDITNKKNTFRMRRDREKIEITYKLNKNKNDGFRKAEELQTTVGDFDTMQKILLELGLVPTDFQEKKRTTYTLHGTLIEIDVYPHIPPYLEIEGKENDIIEVVSLLGYSQKEISTLSASDVIKKYGFDPKNIKF